ncbi:MAG: squalene/phytoene synthase family protein [Burkholderiales bacterium]|nr:squalene/phytoene synthase family protein [Burkholderiales bacterium]
MTPEEYCQSKSSPPGSSLYYSFLFLPPDKRQAVIALFALRDELDEVADGDPAVASIRLAWWQTEIHAMFADRAQHPVGRLLAPAIKRYQLLETGFDDMLLGAESDVAKTRFADYSALRDYCKLAGGAPAGLSAAVFGYSDPSTLHAVVELGASLQLAEIIVATGRDVGRGRLYLPTTELREFDIRVGDIFHRNNSDNFKRLMEFQLTRASAALKQAVAQIPAIDRKAQRPILIRAALAAALLTETAADPGAVLRQRIALTPLRKLWIAWKTRS